MLKVAVLISGLLSVSCAFTQTKVASFTLKGSLTNAPNAQLLFVTHEKNEQKIDTIMTDSEGHFSFSSVADARPIVARLIKPGAFSTDLFAAPGYDLFLAADAADYDTFVRTKKITGKGGATNRYIVLKDSLQLVRKDISEWYNLNDEQLLGFIKRDKAFKDSIHRSVFTGSKTNDRWGAYIANLTQMDENFLHLYYLIVRATYNKSFSTAQMVSYVRNNFNNAVLDDLFNEKYIISQNYRTWLMHEYSNYLKKLHCAKDSSFCKTGSEREQLLKTIAAEFKGKMRERALFGSLKGAIQYSRSFEELNQRRTELPQYVALLKDKADQDRINSLFNEMEKTLLVTQIGSPAPAFTAEDSLGKAYSLADYKGKVVYLDLWASWCGPCRAETPHFKKIFDKYKNDSRIAFVGVAVGDKKDPWMEALREEDTKWLQLFDSDGKVQKAYVANSIPKFILINKEGNIVSFDAPMPSSGAELEKLLDQEVAK
ncbi:MAG: redoxin family protein [Agriterribacter sp.]